MFRKSFVLVALKSIALLIILSSLLMLNTSNIYGRAETAVDQKSLADTLSDLQRIQDLNKQSQDSISPSLSSTSSVLPASQFDSIGQSSNSILPTKPTTGVDNLNTYKNLDTSDSGSTSILDLFKPVDVQAQSDNPFLTGFDKGDRHLPWTKSETWFLEAGYNDGAHLGKNSRLLDFNKSGGNSFNQPVKSMSNGIVYDFKSTCVNTTYACNTGFG